MGRSTSAADHAIVRHMATIRRRRQRVPFEVWVIGLVVLLIVANIVNQARLLIGGGRW